MSPTRILLVLGAAAALTSACGDGGGGPTTPPPELPAPGIHFIAGQNAADSIDALVTLTVEVRDDARKPAAGREVTFLAVGVGTDTPYVTTPGGTPPPATTGADGRLTLGLKLGQHSGEARLVVRVPVLGYVDTARFTVTPGLAVKVAISPRDSTVYVGGGYTVTARILDRYNNQRGDAGIACSATEGAASGAGCAVHGDQVGRGYLVASAVARTDTAWVSVVPRAVIAAYDNHYPIEPGHKTVLANLDGSGITPLGPGSGGPSEEVGLAWSPDGQELALVSGSKVQVLHPGSPGHDLVQPPTQLAETRPRYSRDGSTVFYTAFDVPAQSISLYRVARDGTSPTRFGPEARYARYDYAPSPSPDGRYVAYVSNRDQTCGSCVATTIRIWDVQQDTTTAFGVQGELVAWSPVSDLLAYAAGGAIRVIHADGSGDRLLLEKAVTPRTIDWSPDGRWLLVTTLGVAPRLVEVGTGLVLPIAWAAQYSELTWRP